MGNSPALPRDARNLVWTRAGAADRGAADRQADPRSLPRVLVFGHSHMGALLEAYAAEAAGGNVGFELISYQFLRPERPHIVLADGKWQYHPECRHELRQLIATTQSRLLVSMLQGEQAVLAGLSTPERPFQFYFPEEEGMGDGASEIVPYELLLASCKFEYGLIADLLDLLASENARPSIALSPPPPVGDRDFILTSGLRQADIAELIAVRGLPATAWRYRMWRLHIEALRAIYRDRGIAFADPPAAACGEDGCLLRPYWSDAVHANSAYGRLLLGQIRFVVTNGP